jgi:DNA-binding CsgD family transcriptional regulator
MPAVDGVVDGLLERSRELEVLDGLLNAARRGLGALALIEGPAGIGKSSLLQACADRATDLGMRVLRVRGDEVTVEASFAGVRELLWPAVQGLGGIFEGAARLAAPVFTGEADPAGGQDGVASVLHGLYWLVADLAARSPLALIVDDAHWLDAASVRFLLYLGRRIGFEAAAMAVALRPGDASDPVSRLSELAATVLQPRALSETASGILLRREVGPRADDALCSSCHEATGGNPFYLRELAVALKAEDVRPTRELADRVRSLGAGAIARSVLIRLGRLGGDCERLSEAVAILGPGAPLRQAASLSDLPRERAQRAADQLRTTGLLADTQSLTFEHPIVHEAIIAQLPASRRAAIHARAAAQLAQDGAPADRVAAHLLFAEPYGEAWVVDALRRAARQALGQGAPEPAVAYLRRAIVEPPSEDSRLEVLLELGRAEALLPVAHDFTALRQALELAGDPAQRAEIAHQLADALTGVARNVAARIVLEGALDNVEGVDPTVVERLEAHLLGGGAPELAATSRVLERAAGHFERAKRGEVSNPLMLAALAQTGAIAGLPAAEAAELARMALADVRLLASAPAYLGATGALCWAEQLEEAATAQDRGIAEAQRRGSVPMFMQMSVFRSATSLLAGDLDGAEDHAERALELAQELGTSHFAIMFLIPVLLERGRVDEASAIVESLRLDEPDVQLWQDAVTLAQRGRVRVALGKLETGLEDMLRADRRMSEARCHLSVLSDWVPTAAATLARLRRVNDAQRLAQRELDDANAFGTRRRIGIALSTWGRLDRGPQGLARLEEAVAVLERSPARLEHARSLVNLGAGLRERGQHQAAREYLAQGLDIAYGRGAVPLAELARSELVASGARPRRASTRGPDALTPAEARAARMAADGLSNREIAQALFVSTKTVEGQLSHAYRKLGIHSRTELAAALGAGA